MFLRGVCLFTLLCVTCEVLAQSVAPGDKNELCLTLRAGGIAPVPNYDPSMAILMDSINYQNLLPNRPGAVWQQVDNDNNNAPTITTNWIQQTNSPCNQAVQVCGFTAGPQDNRLITQLINRTVNGFRLPQVRVMIEFELQGCDITLNCQRTFNTHVFETSSVDSAAARNVSNYRQVERVSPSVTDGRRVNETITIDFTSDHSSFYFSIQDETSCIVVTRVIVFYTVCSAGTYLSPSSGRCLQCPANSFSDRDGLTVCTCDPGYYRAPGEEDLPCRKIVVEPAAPTDVQAFCSHAVWRIPPEVSCSDIVNYQLVLFNPTNLDAPSLFVQTSASGTFYTFSEEQYASYLHQDIHLQVRIVTSSALGVLSDPIPLGCPPTEMPKPNVYFELNGELYLNNSEIAIDNVGENEEALICKTDKEECCNTLPNRFGQFHYPNGSPVPIRKAGHGFYRNRGSQLIRLNRRPGTVAPTGMYRCEIPASSGMTQAIFVNLVDAENTHN